MALRKKKRVVRRYIRVEQREDQALCARYTVYADGHIRTEMVAHDGRWHVVPDQSPLSEHPVLHRHSQPGQHYA